MRQQPEIKVQEASPQAKIVQGGKRTKPRREVPDVSSNETPTKVNLDLSVTMLRELDQLALLLNISRQAVIKNFVKDGLDRHFLSQRARDEVYGSNMVRNIEE
jgi:hypothetical protein